MGDESQGEDPPVIEVDWPQDDVAIVTLLGEHDMANAGTVGSILEGLLTRASRLVVDATPARFVDSTIIRTLLDSVRQADHDGVEFALVAERSSIARRVLELAELMASLHVADSLDEAIPSTSGPVRSRSARA
jgi:anti-anti-sigma factor